MPKRRPGFPRATEEVSVHFDFPLKCDDEQRVDRRHVWADRTGMQRTVANVVDNDNGMNQNTILSGNAIPALRIECTNTISSNTKRKVLLTFRK
jgi:hypothetical protein